MQDNLTIKEVVTNDIPHKKSSWDEVFRYALDKYKGNEERAVKFCRGWFSAGEVMKANKDK
jgi:hypothetical protein